MTEEGTRLPLAVPRGVANGAAFILTAIALVGIPLDYSPGGAKSTPLVLGCAVSLGLVAAIGYSIWEKDESRAQRLRFCAWVIIRYFLALVFVRYGVAKLVGMQFFPRFYLLDSRVVDLAPMGLAWSFFGHSFAYQAISGVMEVLGAVLLCFRRTTTLGACVLFGVMSNVTLVNFFFDVSVKTFSSIYLTMISYLLVLEARRFVSFFFTDAPVPPRPYLVSAPRSRRFVIGHLAAFAMVVALPAADILREAASHRVFTHEALLGVWAVDQQVGVDDLSVGASWEKVYFEKGDYGFVRIRGKRVRFTFEHDETTHRLSIKLAASSADDELTGVLDPGSDRTRFVGTRRGHPFELSLTRELSIVGEPAVSVVKAR